MPTLVIGQVGRLPRCRGCGREFQPRLRNDRVQTTCGTYCRTRILAMTRIRKTPR